MSESIHGHTPALDIEAVLADPAGACPACVRAVVERLRHDLDVQRAAMATMLADERQMAAAHDRTRAELDAARGRMRNVRAELLAAEGRLLDARDHVNPRAKSHLDAAARHLRALADGLDGTGDGS